MLRKNDPFQKQKPAILYVNEKNNTRVSTTAIEVNQMMVLPLQLCQRKRKEKWDKKKQIMCFRCKKV